MEWNSDNLRRTSRAKKRTPKNGCKDHWSAILWLEGGIRIRGNHVQLVLASPRKGADLQRWAASVPHCVERAVDTPTKQTTPMNSSFHAHPRQSPKATTRLHPPAAILTSRFASSLLMKAVLMKASWWKRVDESGLIKAGWWKRVDYYIYIYICEDIYIYYMHIYSFS